MSAPTGKRPNKRPPHSRITRKALVVVAALALVGFVVYLVSSQPPSAKAQSKARSSAKRARKAERDALGRADAVKEAVRSLNETGVARMPLKYGLTKPQVKQSREAILAFTQLAMDHFMKAINYKVKHKEETGENTMLTSFTELSFRCD